jgi:hypothetical protein
MPPNKQNKFREKSDAWPISISILLTIALLILSVLIAFKLWQKNDSSIVIIVIMFSVFNVLETFVSILLILDKITREYNNEVRLRLLTYYLKKKNLITEDWVKETTIIVEESVTGGF